MSVSAVWDAHCDGCAFWSPRMTADTRAECKAKAKAAGWLIRRDIVLCPDCRKRVGVNGA